MGTTFTLTVAVAEAVTAPLSQETVYVDLLVTVTAREPLVPEAERPGPETVHAEVSDELHVTVAVFPGCTRAGLTEIAAVG